MVDAFLFDYLLWIFLSARGVVQFVAARTALHGLVLLRTRPRLTEVLSVILVVAAFTWYFASGERNIPDTGQGLDGVEQARWFAIAAGSAVVLIVVASSAVNHRWGAGHGWRPEAERWPPPGFDWLRQTTLLHAVAALLRTSLGRQA